MVDITTLLENLKQAPYTEMTIKAPHSGHVKFAELAPGSRVTGAGGEWREIPGTTIAVITRENNPKPVRATEKGVVQNLEICLEGKFVQAGSSLGVIRHYLTKQEVVRLLLRHSLSLFLAPERAKYYFVPEIDIKVKVQGHKSVSVNNGMDLFIASRMKREIPIPYAGPDGIIYEVFFQQNESVDAGAPLIGVCPPGQRSTIEEVVSRVQLEWTEME